MHLSHVAHDSGIDHPKEIENRIGLEFIVDIAKVDDRRGRDRGLCCEDRLEKIEQGREIRLTEDDESRHSNGGNDSTNAMTRTDKIPLALSLFEPSDGRDIISTEKS